MYYFKVANFASSDIERKVKIFREYSHDVQSITSFAIKKKKCFENKVELFKAMTPILLKQTK